MKIKLNKWHTYYGYNNGNFSGTQKQYDYVFKCLIFNKLFKNYNVFFCDCDEELMFYNTYSRNSFLREIHKESPNGYQYLKDNWCKGVFRLDVFYQDKQELKTIINRVINVKLLRKYNNENKIKAT